MVKKVWNSPTFMTWGSFLSRSLSLIVVLPLVLNQFGVEEVALWLLFTTLIALQMLFQMGFSPTFVRTIAYARAGVSVENLATIKGESIANRKGYENREAIDAIVSAMNVIYSRLSIASFVLFILFGSLAAKPLIYQTADIESSWLSWSFVLLANSVALYGNQYSAYLEGINKIALVRRWEVVTNLLSICSGVWVLLTGGDLFALVFASQIWLVINVIRNFFLCRYVSGGRNYRRLLGKPATNINEHIWAAVWPPAWRSGLGIAMSMGIIQLTGVIYSQYGDVNEVASYLLALRLMIVLSAFSRAPFYTKIPLLSKLWAMGTLSELVVISRKAMGLSMWVFTFGSIFIGLLGDWCFEKLGSNADFPDYFLWVLMSIAFFFERVGSMHLQLYSVTNDIIWHIVNGVGGGVLLFALMLIFPFAGVFAFPLAMIVSSVSFPLWISIKKSHGVFELKVFKFDLYTSVLPFVFLVLSSIAILQFNQSL